MVANMSRTNDSRSKMGRSIMLSFSFLRVVLDSSSIRVGRNTSTCFTGLGVD